MPNTSLREAAPTTTLSTSAPCLMPHTSAYLGFPRHKSLSTSAQCLMPNPQSPIPNLRLSGCSIHLEPLKERLRLLC
ncbi:MAG: hypothetical protein V7L29_04795 [Nostoc sp.]|uniref:hypothetical protein n=1 Tax=Nostoc sp. TaxID=1180 RepID=UPI002FF7274E